MIIEGCITMQAAVQEVWDLFQDIPRVARCVPGCEGVTPLGPDSWEATARSKVGPISVALRGNLRIRERRPPKQIGFRFEGKDTRTSSLVRVLVDLGLDPQGPGATSLSYHADVHLSGRLGQMGQGIVRETAAVLLQEFLGCVHRDLLLQTPARQSQPSRAIGPFSFFLQLRILGRLVGAMLLGSARRLLILWRR
ncbi:MAG: hypothetical protein HY725_01405 [Candidatus Rokubacteria bacterium]|nr:hypothetical protein [Candidatus Rokubacteria bacterium]